MQQTRTSFVERWSFVSQPQERIEICLWQLMNFVDVVGRVWLVGLVSSHAQDRTGRIDRILLCSGDAERMRIRLFDMLSALGQNRRDSSMWNSPIKFWENMESLGLLRLYYCINILIWKKEGNLNYNILHNITTRITRLNHHFWATEEPTTTTTWPTDNAYSIEIAVQDFVQQ